MRKILARAATKLPNLPGEETMERIGVPKKLRRVFLFWQVSFTGWLIDASLLALLVHGFGVPVFFAACVSPIPALLWSFTLSTYKIYFKHEGMAKKFPRRRFGLYLLYNLTMMVVCGWIISQGAAAGFAPLLMKVFVTPLTFFCNFFVTKKLIKGSRKKG